MSDFPVKFRKFCNLKLSYSSIVSGKQEEAIKTISELTNEELTDYLSLSEYCGDGFRSELSCEAMQRLMSKL